MILIKDVKYIGKKGEKLLCKVYVEKESIKFSIAAREAEEPILVDVVSLMEPYIKPTGLQVMRKVCNVVYLRCQQEIRSKAS